MKMKRILRSFSGLITVVTILVLVQACSSNMGNGSMASYSGSWGNYKCRATSKKPGGHTGIGWATNRDDAEDNALDKCRANSADPNSCYVTKCYSS